MVEFGENFIGRDKFYWWTECTMYGKKSRMSPRFLA